MKRIIHYQLERDDSQIVNRIGETLNMINFVFTHRPELKPMPKQLAKDKQSHPHKLVMNGAPFTYWDFEDWLDWSWEVIRQGQEVIPLQPEPFREGHAMALKRFEEEREELESLFQRARKL
jgi:hypothetical protein